MPLLPSADPVLVAIAVFIACVFIACILEIIYSWFMNKE